MDVVPLKPSPRDPSATRTSPSGGFKPEAPTPTHLSRGRLSILLSSSSCRCSFSCSFCSRSSTSRSRAAVSTGLAPPKMEAARLDCAAGATAASSSLGALRGFRFSFGLCVGPAWSKSRRASAHRTPSRAHRTPSRGRDPPPSPHLCPRGGNRPGRSRPGSSSDPCGRPAGRSGRRSGRRSPGSRRPGGSRCRTPSCRCLSWSRSLREEKPFPVNPVSPSTSNASLQVGVYNTTALQSNLGRAGLCEDESKARDSSRQGRRARARPAQPLAGRSAPGALGSPCRPAVTRDTHLGRSPCCGHRSGPCPRSRGPCPSAAHRDTDRRSGPGTLRRTRG